MARGVDQVVRPVDLDEDLVGAGRRVVETTLPPVETEMLVGVITTDESDSEITTICELSLPVPPSLSVAVAVATSTPIGLTTANVNVAVVAVAITMPFSVSVQATVAVPEHPGR